MEIFNFFGSIFGYLLWAAYYLVNNFGIAIIIFTLVFKIVLFPSSVKQQKSMAANSKLQARQRALQEKYGNDKQKYNEELQKLYEKENFSPFVLEEKCNNKITIVQKEPSTLAIDAPAIPMFKGNTNTISNMTFNTPPDITAIMASFGAPSFLTKVCKRDENEKALRPRMTYGA